MVFEHLMRCMTIQVSAELRITGKDYCKITLQVEMSRNGGASVVWKVRSVAYFPKVPGKSNMNLIIILDASCFRRKVNSKKSERQLEREEAYRVQQAVIARRKNNSWQKVINFPCLSFKRQNVSFLLGLCSNEGFVLRDVTLPNEIL